MSGIALDLQYRGKAGFALHVTGHLPASGITAIYGPSGSGKSTLLDCIAGLRQPERGSRVQFRGESWLGEQHALPAWRRNIGYVFQDARLFPQLTVLQNLRYSLTRATRAPLLSMADAVAWFELDTLLDRHPDALSAGQKQRVAIARTLLNAPRLLLLDEPAANLDHAASLHCMEIIRRLAQKADLPVLYVSHDIEEVSQFADYLAIMACGEIVDRGSLLTLCSRLDTRLSHEEQAAAIVVGSIKQHDDRYRLTELEVEGQPLMVTHLPQAPGQCRRIRIPARDVSICLQRPADSSILNILPVTVTEIEHSGDARLMLRLALGKQFILARITRKSAANLQLQVGDHVYAQIKSAALLSEVFESA